MPDITLKATIDYETTQPYKVELTRSQKGTYGWTITVHAMAADQAIEELDKLDKNLCDTYLPPTPVAQEETKDD